MPAIFAAGDGTEIAKYLRNAGLNYVYGFDKEIIDYLLSSKVTDLMTCSDRTGWVNDVFITPKRVYGDDAESYTYQPIGAIDNKIGQAGTLADWQANVSRYAQGNPLTMTCISESFTGPLLKTAQMMGFGLHLYSSSSDGKTTTLHVACSVWGNEFWQQWLSTSVGIEGSAYAHNDLFLALDEIGEATAQTVSATAYALANGEGKRRGGRDGNAKATKKWRLPFLSTGEKSLDTMMKEAGMVTRAGQEVRMVGQRSDMWKHGAFNDLHGMENGSVFAEMLEANTQKYYGTAGDAWLDAITQLGGIPDDISQSVDLIRESFLPDGASGQVRRIARQYALIAYAGELATKHGITGWKAGEATAAVKECFLLAVEDFGGADGKREHRQVLEAVESFLFANITRFQGTCETLYRGSKERVGFVRNNPGDDGAFLVPTTQLTQLAEGYSREQIITALRIAGKLNEPGKDGKNAIVLPHRDNGKQMKGFIITL
jgi:putative DNA primase/helicase